MADPGRNSRARRSSRANSYDSKQYDNNGLHPWSESASFQSTSEEILRAEIPQVALFYTLGPTSPKRALVRAHIPEVARTKERRAGARQAGCDVVSLHGTSFRRQADETICMCD